ncbi:MAG: septum site-determining protein MinD, partial [Clostridiales bacterium]|nr:septum site-determining protein MinD [Clostridiales bacterium]
MARKFVIASGKGGVGKSSVAAGLGNALASQGKRVLLIDTDTGLRSLDIILGVGERVVYDWGDVLAGNCELERAFLHSESGLCLLSAPSGATFKAD